MGLLETGDPQLAAEVCWLLAFLTAKEDATAALDALLPAMLQVMHYCQRE